MIVLNDLFLKYGDRVLFDHITLSIKEKDRIGLVGRNGAGKSTLLNILRGSINPDSGIISTPSSTTVGYLQQEIDFTTDRGILEETMLCFEEVQKLKDKIENINQELSKRTDYESKGYLDLISKLTASNERLHYLDDGNLEGRTVKVLNGLGFEEKELQNSVMTLSGGWKMRIELAKLLLTEPDLLLLDEPTNHLDIESIIWLEHYLSDYSGIIVLISHDVQFLDNTVNRVIEIELGKIYDIKGNYSLFRNEKEKQREIREAAYINQQKTIAQKERTITRFMAKATKTRMAQSMQKQLDKIERIEIPQEDTSALKIKFSDVPRSSRIMLDAKGIYKSYGVNNVLKNIDFRLERGDKVAFIGQNGQGKTTLARIINRSLDITSGKLNFGDNIYTSYYAQNQTELLDDKLTVLEVADEAAPAELRTKVRSILGAFLFSGEDVDKKVSVLSGGEKSRLALACMIMHPSNLIILDEPTNHLDIIAKEILREALDQYAGSLIIVSHDRDFLKGLTHKVYEFKDHRIKEFLGDIEYYLEKRKVESLREVELTSNPNIKNVRTKVDPSDRVNFKELQKKVKYCERDIEKLEKEFSEIGIFLTESTDYESAEYIEKSRMYKSLSQQIEEKMEEWGRLTEDLESYT